MQKFKHLLTVSLSLILTFTMSSSVFAFDMLPIEAENSYYSEKSIQFGTDALSIIGRQDLVEEFTNIQAQNELELVAVSKQTVYVIETVDQNGNICSSRLMSQNEVEQYQAITQPNVCSTNVTLVGDDGESHQGGKLSIYLLVYKNSSSTYYAYGMADWEDGIYNTGAVNCPASGYDFFSITWGGNGELKTSAQSIGGIYQYDHGDISFSRAESDSYRGYSWQFNEKSSIFYADYIHASVTLNKTYSTYQAKQTNIRLTYIHTYQSAVGTISFQGGYNTAAAGVSLSSCANQWQLQVDVPGIYY